MATSKTPRLKKDQPRFFLDYDQWGRFAIIPWERRDEWLEWVSDMDGNPDSVPPEWVRPFDTCDCSNFSFTDWHYHG